jgi:hypothetical protein
MRNIEQRLWWQTRAMTRREVITKAITRQLTWGAAERDCGNQCPAYAAATPKCRTLGDGLNRRSKFRPRGASTRWPATHNRQSSRRSRTRRMTRASFVFNNAREDWRCRFRGYVSDGEKQGRVASGIAPRGSHRSGHADFPHPALQPTASLRDRGGANARLRQGIACKQPKHFLPREPSPLRTTVQPLVPHGNGTETEDMQGIGVSGDTEIQSARAASA